MTALAGMFRGDGLFARAMRSSVWTILGFGGSQAIRLASNLILTRLLFPEAFGMMALIMVIMQGLANFSDVGTGPAIMQNKRGDDPDFLNTAWTLQAIRGFCLWMAACALAWPVSIFYNEPMLAQLLPVAGFALFLAGFNPTRLETANRHLTLGRVTLVETAIQLIGVAVSVILAWILQSVWALIIGLIVGAVAKLVLSNLLLPGIRNRFRWDRSAVGELVNFGKWIFLSTACGFLLSQGDKLVLGKYVTLDVLGIYNIGYFLASFPMLLGSAVIWRILIPIYRERPPAAAPENYRKIRFMRLGLTGCILSTLLIMASLGVFLVEFLYDPRYAAAGAIVVIVALMQIPVVIGMTYDQAALAAGDSRRYFVLVAAKTVAQMAALLIGIELAGLIGALIGQGIAMLVVYPVVIWLARRQGAWDPLHDGLYGIAAAAVGAGVLWLNWEAILALGSFGAL